MKSISVHTELCALKPGLASDVEPLRVHAVAGRRAVKRFFGCEHGTSPPLRAAVDAEIQKAYEALVSARRLRRYVGRLIGENGRTLSKGRASPTAP